MSAKTTAEKVQIKPGATLWLSDPARVGRIGPLPDGVTMADSLVSATSAIVFAYAAASLRETLDANRDHLAGPSVFWVAYPKANQTDTNRDKLWPILTEHGMRPNSQVAVDDVWSALRFRPLKEGEAPFTGGR